MGYHRTGREDPRLAGRIQAALGNARTVVNVGAGTGSYGPPGLMVTGVEPSAVMIVHRPPGVAPAVRAAAEALPFSGRLRFDAALPLWTIHHWADPRPGTR